MTKAKPNPYEQQYLDFVAQELYHQLRLFHLTDPTEFESRYMMEMLSAFYQVAAKSPKRTIGRYTITDVPRTATNATIEEIIEWMKSKKIYTTSFGEWERAL